MFNKQIKQLNFVTDSWRTSNGSSQRSHSQGKPNCPWMKTFRLTAHRGTRASSHWFQENTKFWGLASFGILSIAQVFGEQNELVRIMDTGKLRQADSSPSSKVQLMHKRWCLIIARGSSAPHPANRTTRESILEHLKNKSNLKAQPMNQQICLLLIYEQFIKEPSGLERLREHVTVHWAWCGEGSHTKCWSKTTTPVSWTYLEGVLTSPSYCRKRCCGAYRLG